jgi:hypothetical protein
VTAAPLLVRWIAGDATRVRVALAAALGIEVPAGRSIAIPGLRLEISEGGPGPGSRAADRLEVVGADPWSKTVPTADDPTAAGARFLALGWATVDLDRVAAAWAGVRWAAAPRDSLVGARALLGGPDTTGRDATGAGIVPQGLTVTTLLLEPDTEGRLAAALARHGEGPAVLYIGLRAVALARARTRLARLRVPVSAGPGPFGPGIAIAGTPAWSPTLIILPARGPDGTDGTGGPTRGGPTRGGPTRGGPTRGGPTRGGPTPGGRGTIGP